MKIVFSSRELTNTTDVIKRRIRNTNLVSLQKEKHTNFVKKKKRNTNLDASHANTNDNQP